MRTLPNGTRLIGHTPHVAPEAFFHVIFPPLTHKEIDELESSLGRLLPIQLIELYQTTNGLSLFSYSLHIDGLRCNYIRSGDEAWQPFSIMTANLTERPRDAEPTQVFFGGYKSDGSALMMQPPEDEVFRCERRSSKVLNRWSSFDNFLVSEVRRLEKLFDDSGHSRNPKLPTTPLREFNVI